MHFADDPHPHSKSSNAKSRYRTNHIRDVHPERLASDQIFALPKRIVVRNTAHTRREKAVKFLETYKGAHKFVVGGYHIACEKCGWKGSPVEDGIPTKCCKKLVRGGSLLGRLARAVKTKADGMCMWHSIAFFLGRSPFAIRDRVAATLKGASSMLWEGASLEHWAAQDTGLDWKAYVRAIRKGLLWPGVLELLVAANLFSVQIQVFEKHLQDFQQVLDISPGGEHPVWRIEWQNKSHFEPLRFVECALDAGSFALQETATSSKPNCSSSASCFVADADAAEAGAQARPMQQQMQLKILCANISSFNLHHEEFFLLANQHQVNVAIAIETRIMTNIPSVRYWSAKAGFSPPLLSSPRPMKVDGAPREGGLGIFLRAPLVPSSAVVDCPEFPCDDMLHTTVPLGKKQVLHIVALYAPRAREDLRRFVFDYAAGLGRHPIIIAGDFNATIGDNADHRLVCQALDLALATGLWVDLLAHSCVGTTHKAGSVGRRVDFLFANQEAVGFVTSSAVLEQTPFVNHFPLLAACSFPTAPPRVLQIKPTTSFKKVPSKACVGALAEADWLLADELTLKQFFHDLKHDAHELAWFHWNSLAQRFLHTCAQRVDVACPEGRAKGSMPSYIMVPLWQKVEPCPNRRLNRLAFRLRRLHLLFLCETLQSSYGELLALSQLVAADLMFFFDQVADFDAESLVHWKEVVANYQKQLAKDARKQAIEKWRDKMGSSLRDACRWVKAEMPKLTSIDDASGFMHTHPQEIVDVVFERCKLKFGMAHDFHELDHLLRFSAQVVRCSPMVVAPIGAEALRARVAAKRHSTHGLDGWSPYELGLLPLQLWQMLADLLLLVEESGQWPESLMFGYHTAMPKASKKLDICKVQCRLLFVLPVVVRAWSGIRASQVTQWMASWMPASLHGGIPGRSTATATSPIAATFAELALGKKPCCGISLDYSDCFDRISPSTGVGLLTAWGLDMQVSQALLHVYENMQRYVIVSSCAAGPFKAVDGVFQGCAFSICIINGLMATWALYVELQLGGDFVAHHRILFSVYLDDRNIVAGSVLAIEKVMRVSAPFDLLFRALLNMQKTQIYASSEEALAELLVVFPEAAVQSRAWSLGFPLPTGFSLGTDISAGKKVQSRYLTAASRARRAVCLPHDIRLKVLTVTYGPTFCYGIEYEPPCAVDASMLCQAIYQSLTGGSRPSGSRLIFWTVLYKGHVFHPIALFLRDSVRWLRAFWASDQRALFQQSWHSPARFTPMGHFQQVMTRLGWEWHDYMKIRGPMEVGDLDHVIDLLAPRAQLAHSLRQLWRFWMFRQNKPRNDMAGIELGIDYRATRRLYEVASLSPFQRGMMRSILLGALLTPGRMAFAGLLSDQEALCPLCDLLEFDTVGHRWHCPANLKLLQKFGLLDCDLLALPKCLTRCGIVPAAPAAHIRSDLWLALCFRIQSFLLEVTVLVHGSQLTQQQLALGMSRTPKNLKRKRLLAAELDGQAEELDA